MLEPGQNAVLVRNFPDQNSLRVHNDRVHKGTVWPCDKFDKIYKRSRGYNVHKKTQLNI